MIIFLLLACGDAKKNDSDNNIEPSSDSYHVDISSLTKIEECEEFTDNDGTYPREAATVYASGQFSIEGSDISGIEKLHLLPTEAWSYAASSQPDWEPCEIIWTIRGTEDPIGVISITASYQGGLTTCPEYISGFYDETFNNTYNITRNADGSAVWMYSNGTEFGEGSYTDSSLDFLSDPKCENLGNIQTPQ